SLLFGLNANERKDEKISAYVPSADTNCDDAKKPVFKTELEGEYSDKEGNMHKVNMSVISELTGSSGDHMLKYTIKQGKDAVKVNVTLPASMSERDGYYWLSANDKNVDAII